MQEFKVVRKEYRDKTTIFKYVLSLVIGTVSNRLELLQHIGIAEGEFRKVLGKGV